ncbi:methyltransferase [Allosphingosinicella flava]|uniref:Methyltransferase n=1 Tax=Allosphingosinicella flava TaxID=2771430 RepID=A0A7T2GI35_9SPHN|nr:methyltransferase [Sphingosinicella flava]QPQ54246.1 methyltransferase [Sphingosinicella flava]
MRALDCGQLALLRLLEGLRAGGYRFVTVTPDSHRRILAREPGRLARDLRDIFGWNLPFRPASLDQALLGHLREANALDEAGEGLLKSRVRVSSLDELLFLHSAYPTEAEDSVFFGPDSYRFAAFLQAELKGRAAPRRIVDIGAGSGVGGIVAARALGLAAPVLTDINPAALRLAAVNACFAEVDVVSVEGSGLDGVGMPFDLAIANPPFIADGQSRAYRDGGDMHGAGLSLDWTVEAARRVERGGHVLLYTGSAIVSGRDRLRDALEEALPPLQCTLRYREIDPDIFGEELSLPAYAGVDRIAAVGAVIEKA